MEGKAPIRPPAKEKEKGVPHFIEAPPSFFPQIVLMHVQRHVINVHIIVISSSVSVLVIQELDADGLTCIGRQVEAHLNPGLVIGGASEELFNDCPAAVDYIRLLPGVGARVIAGGPVEEGQAGSFCTGWNRD